MSARTKGLALLAVLIAVVVACAHDRHPVSVGHRFAGVYPLHAVNEREVPMAWGASAFGRASIVGGTVELRQDGGFTETVDTRSDYYEPPGTVNTTLTRRGTYFMRGDRITFQTPPDSAGRWTEYQGTVYGGGAGIRYAYDGARFWWVR